jgi:hypothetical protein
MATTVLAKEKFTNWWKDSNWGELVLLMMRILGGLECNVEHIDHRIRDNPKHLDYETETSISHREICSKNN